MNDRPTGRAKGLDARAGGMAPVRGKGIEHAVHQNSMPTGKDDSQGRRAAVRQQMGRHA